MTNFVSIWVYFKIFYFQVTTGIGSFPSKKWMSINIYLFFYQKSSRATYFWAFLKDVPSDFIITPLSGLHHQTFWKTPMKSLYSSFSFTPPQIKSCDNHDVLLKNMTCQLWKELVIKMMIHDKSYLLLSLTHIFLKKSALSFNFCRINDDDEPTSESTSHAPETWFFPLCCCYLIKPICKTLKVINAC